MNTFQLAKKKKFIYPFGLVLMIIALAVITGISALFFNDQFVFASGNEIVLKDVSEGYLSGAYKIKSAKDPNLCFDVEGGKKLENSIKILAFGSHTYANQKFNFTPIEYNGSYIYTISTIYSDTYVLDISGGLPDENTSLQIYQYNSTAAQKFMIKAVYVGETFKGYVLLTGTTGYQKVLSNSNGYIVWADGGWTKIFIYPGYRFKVLDALVTNFHLPESTLIMLVSALAGKENVLRAYETAVKEGYRFFSFGDAMFIS